MDCRTSDKDLLPLLPKCLKDVSKENKYCLICPFTIDVINKAMIYTNNNLPKCGYNLYWR